MNPIKRISILFFSIIFSLLPTAGIGEAYVDAKTFHNAKAIEKKQHAYIVPKHHDINILNMIKTHPYVAAGLGAGISLTALTSLLFWKKSLLNIKQLFPRSNQKPVLPSEKYTLSFQLLKSQKAPQKNLLQGRIDRINKAEDSKFQLIFKYSGYLNKNYYENKEKDEDNEENKKITPTFATITTAIEVHIRDQQINSKIILTDLEHLLELYESKNQEAVISYIQQTKLTEKDYSNWLSHMITTAEFIQLPQDFLWLLADPYIDELALYCKTGLQDKNIKNFLEEITRYYGLEVTTPIPIVSPQKIGACGRDYSKLLNFYLYSASDVTALFEGNSGNIITLSQAGTLSNLIEIWNPTQPQKPIKILDNISDIKTSSFFASNKDDLEKKILVTGSAQNASKLWDLTTGTCTVISAANNVDSDTKYETPKKIDISPDGTRFVRTEFQSSWNIKDNAVVWNIENQKQIFSFEDEYDIESSWLISHEKLLTYSQYNLIVHDIVCNQKTIIINLKKDDKFSLYTKYIEALIVSPKKEKTFVSCSSKLNPSTGLPNHLRKSFREGKIVNLKSSNQKLEPISLENFNEIEKYEDFKNNLENKLCKFSPTEKYLLIATNESKNSIHFRIWDTESGKIYRHFSADKVPNTITVRSIDISPDGKNIIAIFEGKGVVILDFHTGKILHEIDDPDLYSAQFSPYENGKFLLMKENSTISVNNLYCNISVTPAERFIYEAFKRSELTEITVDKKSYAAQIIKQLNNRCSHPLIPVNSIEEKN